MVTILATSELYFNLVKEALTNHGFSYNESRMKRYWFFGQTIYKITVSFIPRLSFLEHLLREAEKIEDYVNAAGIRNMIEIKKRNR